MQRALAAVIADPWADGPRERFAEQVAATDPERSAFIEAQLAVARARKAAAVRRRSVEADALVAGLPGLVNGARWCGGIAPLLAYNGRCGPPWRFRRGFVEEVTLPAAHFLRVAGSLYARAPILDVVLTDVKPVAAELFSSSHLARLRSLDLSVNALGDAEIRLLTRSRHLVRLRWLSLYYNDVTDDGVNALAAARATLPALRYLRLDANPCVDPNPVASGEQPARALDLQARHGLVAWLGDNPSGDPPDPETYG